MTQDPITWSISSLPCLDDINIIRRVLQAMPFNFVDNKKSIEKLAAPAAKEVPWIYIVMCQRGGVSNEPPWLQAATRHGARDPSVRYIR